MSKVITFSTRFPSYHPKAGQPTFFPEKILNSLDIAYRGNGHIIPDLSELVTEEKHHTIRGGKRWKDGDIASLRIWSGLAYRSKQIIIAPEVTIKVKEVQIANGLMWIDHKKVAWETVAKNDGLSMEELRWWFNKPEFEGQLLIWNNTGLTY